MITLENIRLVDPQGLWDKLCTFDEQLRDAVFETEDYKIDIDRNKIRDVVITGMGGAIIGGELIRAMCLECGHLPVHVNKSYSLPSFVNDRTLVIAVSQSGNTEETLSSFEEAGARGAQRVIITTGGILADMASEQQIPVILLPKSRITRAALAYSFTALWRVFQHLEVFQPGNDELNGAADFLEEQIEILSGLEENIAIEMAADLKSTLPIIYSGDGLMAPVALRWKTQFHENAKVLAYCSHIPEMNHNEIEGWELTAHLMGKLSVIILQDDSDHMRVRHRMDVTAQLIEPHSLTLKRVHSIGENVVQRVLFMILMGDFISFYLAILSEVDPLPIEKIELLKRRLNEIDV
ncbi:MAG: bifunctional phosphoglucose/phosphomannose isomerase [Candidatus Cyclonatronum sp.]|uniref:bifunctional phosphoglucose/phosphomannose isomerase n=1 Tax=Cyclonatronum sp. TaxID=3024185 RepID=UPI0025C0AC30|nr:bifunctional phosphoglucose/phosphomannose isomerase [Cyclonatronum sp.]MCC5934624.1 bifunctional phosphoglucose/phosphomannose isomerase [Balneolales bacterium]MCH8487252.1 bifunctional phosphoglucose/phosphomannose isomerase [Cyclonatronum sp.]